MDAATRSTSTPLGQVVSPILNAFVSEYFLWPDKQFYCIRITHLDCQICLILLKIYKTAPFKPKKKLSLKLWLATVFGWNFEKREYVAVEQIPPGEGAWFLDGHGLRCTLALAGRFEWQPAASACHRVGVLVRDCVGAFLIGVNEVLLPGICSGDIRKVLLGLMLLTSS